MFDEGEEQPYRTPQQRKADKSRKKGLATRLKNRKKRKKK